MRTTELRPTARQLIGAAEETIEEAIARLEDAYQLFSDCADGLRADWSPDLSVTSRQAAACDRILETISAGMRLITEIREVAGR